MPPTIHGVVQRDQHARQQCRQREFDDHDAVHRRGRQHDDGAERGLHQPEASDAEPAEMRRRDHASTAERSAKALTSMPST
jgi:G:T/U-mismatch repair DNA glycosylase